MRCTHRCLDLERQPFGAALTQHDLKGATPEAILPKRVRHAPDGPEHDIRIYVRHHQRARRVRARLGRRPRRGRAVAAGAPRAERGQPVREALRVRERAGAGRVVGVRERARDHVGGVDVFEGGGGTADARGGERVGGADAVVARVDW